MPNEDSGVPEPVSEEEALQRKELKARRKVRAAWISFVGRIAAQLIGAAATVTLGVLIAHHVGHAQRSDPQAAAASVTAATVSAAGLPIPSRGGVMAVAVLPLVDGRQVRVTAEIVDGTDGATAWRGTADVAHALAADAAMAHEVAYEVGAALAARSRAADVRAVKGDRPGPAAVSRTFP